MFNKDNYDKIVNFKKAKAISSIAVFYDIQNPINFVSDIKDILDKDGVWILEQSYLPLLIKNNAYDSICHEHLSYFMYRQIKNLLDKGQIELDIIELLTESDASYLNTIGKSYVKQLPKVFASDDTTFAKTKIKTDIPENKPLFFIFSNCKQANKLPAIKKVPKLSTCNPSNPNKEELPNLLK